MPAPFLTHPLPLNGISQQLDHVLTFHPTALETFGPGNEGALWAEESCHFPSSLCGTTAHPTATWPHTHSILPCPGSSGDKGKES